MTAKLKAEDPSCNQVPESFKKKIFLLYRLKKNLSCSAKLKAEDPSCNQVPESLKKKKSVFYID
jgi:hypothetical protein